MIGGRVKQSLGASAHCLRAAELIHPDLYFVGACGVDLRRRHHRSRLRRS
jgi:hypothetical protein